MKEESRLYFDNVFWDPASDISKLFTTASSWMNKPLAAFYGLTGPTGAAFQKVPLDPTQRVGFLTQAALMAVNAKPDESHPVIRGKFVREKLFCQFLPSPPDNLVIVPPDPSPNLTTRQRYAVHSATPACAGCHAMMDPLGFGFENYDAIGAYRAKKNNVNIDASGSVSGTLDANGPYNGAVELAAKLAPSQTVKDCITTQWFRFAVGRQESAADACSLEKSRALFKTAGQKLPELLVAMTQTDAFLFKKVVAPGGAQ